MSLPELLEARGEAVSLFRAVVDTLGTPPDRVPPLDTARETSFVLARTVGADPLWHQGLLELRDERARLQELERVFRAALG